MTRSVLFGILLVLLGSPAVGDEVPLPEFFGTYAVVEGGLVGLDVSASTVTPDEAEISLGQRAGVSAVLQGGAPASNQGLRVAVFPADIQLLLFYQSAGMTNAMMLAGSLRLRPLHYVRKITVDTGFPKKVRRSGTEDGWDTADAAELLGGLTDLAPPVELLVKPVKGEDDMVLARPSAPLEPGVYSLSGGPLSRSVLFAVTPLDEARSAKCVDVECTYMMMASKCTARRCGGTAAPRPTPAERVSETTLGEFRHGTLVRKNAKDELVLASPEEAEFTHPGVDLVTSCGKAVYAAADGRVRETRSVIPVGDEKRGFGYMVVVKHDEPIDGRDTYSLYAHLQDPPAVKAGDRVRGGKTVLGAVGDTGNATGCHLHLELRHFPDEFCTDENWNDPPNAYGVGDQRQSDVFLRDWIDPVQVFPFKWQHVHGADAPGYSVRVGHIHDYFLATGTCTGLLTFTPDRIVYLSESHGFDVPCSDIKEIKKGSKSIWKTIDDQVRASTIKITLTTEGRRGRAKDKTFHFLAEAGTTIDDVLAHATCD